MKMAAATSGPYAAKDSRRPSMATISSPHATQLLRNGNAFDSASEAGTFKSNWALFILTLLGICMHGPDTLQRSHPWLRQKTAFMGWGRAVRLAG